MQQRLPIVLSTVALVVAVLGWTPVGESARSLVIPKGSVGTAQLKNGAVTPVKLRKAAVTTPKLKNGAVTSLKVLDGSLLAKDFKAGQLPAGAKGDKGDPGAPGLSELQVVNLTSASNSNETKSVTVGCPAGKTLIGGGGAVSFTPGTDVALLQSRPGNNEWVAVGGEIVATASNWVVQAWAICAKTS
jgi:hypothetical protein